MNSSSSLIALFIRDLLRRRILWFLVTLIAAMVAFNYLLAQNSATAVEGGASADAALHQAAATFDQWIAYILPRIMVVGVVMAVLIAPESRRNGTTQFVLSVPMKRRSLAFTQFASIAVFISIAYMIIHFGVAIGGWRVGTVGLAEAAGAWVTLVIPALAVSAVVFALSLVFSLAATLVLCLAIPSGLVVLTEAVRQAEAFDPTVPLKMLEHAAFLFPAWENLIFWPRLPTEALNMGPATPGWGWLLAHEVLVVAFWVMLGSWLYLRHDFGSRTALK